MQWASMYDIPMTQSIVNRFFDIILYIPSRANDQNCTEVTELKRTVLERKNHLKSPVQV